MADTGTLYPGTVTTAAVAPYDDFDWTNPTNVLADDTNYASITDNAYDTGQQSYLMSVRNFGSYVPTDGTITGVKVEIGKYYVTGVAKDGTVQLINGIGTPLGTSLATADAWPTSLGTVTYGGSTTLWGAVLTPEIVNGTSFGLQFAGSAAGNNCDSHVDFIRMVIYYSVPSITAADNNQAQVTDLATLGVWHPLSAAENNQAQVSDLAALGVWTPVDASEQVQAQVFDASVLGVWTPVAVSEQVQAQTNESVSANFQAAAGTAAPTTAVLDNFNRIAGTSLGTAWGGPFMSGNGNWKIAGSSAYPLSAIDTFPLGTSSNGRYIQDARGSPWLMVADSPQGMAVNCSLAEVDQFLTNRTAKGFNCIQVHAIAGLSFGGSAGRETYDGVAPFTTAGSIDTPNANYFNRLGSMIDIAELYDVAVMLTAAEYIDSIDLFTDGGTAKSYSFGQYLGTLYANKNNIIWNYGNDVQDWKTSGTKMAVLNAVCDGVKSTNHSGLHTSWLDYYISASRFSSDWESRVNIDFAYTYYPPYSLMLDERGSVPARPVYLGESNYETEDQNPHGYTTTDTHIRKQNYWTMMGGGCGITYCNGPSTYAFEAGWAGSLDSYPGGEQVPYFVALFKSFDWWTLTPDSGSLIMTSGHGTYEEWTTGNTNTGTYALGAYNSATSTYVAYIPSSRQVVIDMAQMSGTGTRARWYDPVNGTYSAYLGTYATTGTVGFTPSSGDWILRVDTVS